MKKVYLQASWIPSVYGGYNVDRKILRKILRRADNKAPVNCGVNTTRLCNENCAWFNEIECHSDKTQKDHMVVYCKGEQIAEIVDGPEQEQKPNHPEIPDSSKLEMIKEQTMTDRIFEAFLGQIEEQAKVANHKYESELAATLRDVCKIHEPAKFSAEQIKCFLEAMRVLIDGRGKLNRETAHWTRSRLLGVGLTWLPVTKKAAKDISDAQKSI